MVKAGKIRTENNETNETKLIDAEQIVKKAIEFNDYPISSEYVILDE